MSDQTIAVIGAGSWGTALGIVLSRNNNLVYLVDKDSELIDTLSKERINERYVPGVRFPDSLRPEKEIGIALEKTNDVVISVPCSALEEVFLELAETKQNYNICLCSKGLAPGKHILNHKVANSILSEGAKLAVLSGPSFAGEVANGLPTAVAVASDNHQLAEHFAGLFHNDVFRVYTQDDIVGVQVGGAIKNVMAIAAGIADGLGFGANTRAAVITRGLTEIMRLGVALGGRQETFMGLAGLGDLVLTCTDNQSRNRRFGLFLAKGKTTDEALKEIGQTVEGIRTVKELIRLAEEYTIEIDAVRALLAREQKAEQI